MPGRTQNVTLPTSLASRKLLRVSITMMQLQRNEKEKKTPPRSAGDNQVRWRQIQWKVKEKKKEKQHHERNFSWVKSAMKQGTILKSSSRYSIWNSESKSSSHCHNMSEAVIFTAWTILKQKQRHHDR